MRQDDLLLRTKIVPPRLPPRVLPRPALQARLREALDLRLTIVQAGTGYSKTTALATLAAGTAPCFWYSLGEADGDPPRFLAYLLAAFRQRLRTISDLPAALLQEPDGAGSAESWTGALDALINTLVDTLQSPALLILDDYHLVADRPSLAPLLDRFLTYLPPSSMSC